LAKELPGLERIPWQGELGKRVYESDFKGRLEALAGHSKMIMNEYRLNPLDPNSQKIMGEQMEQFFFGEGAKLPEGYVAPKAKGLVALVGYSARRGMFDGQAWRNFEN